MLCLNQVCRSYQTLLPSLTRNEQLAIVKWFAPNSLSKSFSLKLKKEWHVLLEAQPEKYSRNPPLAHLIYLSRDPTVTRAVTLGGVTLTAGDSDDAAGVFQLR